jgi:hypothetical protein
MTLSLEKSFVENKKISIDYESEFEIYGKTNNLILEFNSSDITQNDDGGACFCPEPQYNGSMKIVWGLFSILKGKDQSLN